MEEKKCMCANEGILREDMTHLYDKITELPFVNHEPEECKCRNELKQYWKNEKKVWLCSCCVIGEKLV